MNVADETVKGHSGKWIGHGGAVVGGTGRSSSSSSLDSLDSSNSSSSSSSSIGRGGEGGGGGLAPKQQEYNAKKKACMTIQKCYRWNFGLLPWAIASVRIQRQW